MKCLQSVQHPITLRTKWYKLFRIASVSLKKYSIFIILSHEGIRHMCYTDIVKIDNSGKQVNYKEI